MKTPPTILNGYPVIAYAPLSGPSYDAFVVLVQRPEGDYPHPFVVAKWYPTRMVGWSGGFYHSTYAAAMAQFKDYIRV